VLIAVVYAKDVPSGVEKKGQKRQGYKGEWREPKLFTIYLLDKQGKIVKSFSPLHDATMGDHKTMFALLARYLSALSLADAARLVFCGDGAPWIWSGVEELCRRMGLPETCSVYQVLDYIHAQQNLQEMIDLVARRIQKKEKIAEKWQDYFESNAKRMQYKAFKAACIPCGSGCVESAIRHIINLRLKSAGTFWKRDMAEYFLFLRSQLLSGRWLIFVRNVIRQQARILSNFHDCQDVELFQPALSDT